MSFRIWGIRSKAALLVCAGLAVSLLTACISVQEGQTQAPKQTQAPLERLKVASVSVEKHTYAPGETIQINFSNGPGHQYDWVAVYKDGVRPGSGIFTELFLFTDGTNPGGTEGITRGSLMFDASSDNPENDEVDWPLAEGKYDVYYFCCDDYGILAGPAEFEVVSGGGD